MPKKLTKKSEKQAVEEAQNSVVEAKEVIEEEAVDTTSVEDSTAEYQGSGAICAYDYNYSVQTGSSKASKIDGLAAENVMDFVESVLGKVEKIIIIRNK